MRSVIVIDEQQASAFRAVLVQNGVQFTEAGNFNSPTVVFKSEQPMKLLYHTFIKSQKLKSKRRS